MKFVSVEDTAMLANIKAAIEQLRGVASVTDGVSYDTTDCDAYREAMEDVKVSDEVPFLYVKHPFVRNLDLRYYRKTHERHGNER